MGQNDILFIEIMAALGVIGVVAFLIVLISRVIPAQQRAGKSTLDPAQQWYGYFLAAIVLTIATLLFLWRFPPSYMAQIADLDWQLDARSMTFFVIMLVILALALLAFIVFVIWQQVNRKTVPGAAEPAIETAASLATDIEVAKYPNPSGVSLLGLLALAVAYAILNWSYVPLNQQHMMMLQLVYPAGFVIALVMMFDKASRAWNIKAPGESLREWIFCNTVTFLYVLGFLNLLKSSNGDAYSAMVVDLVNVIAFLFIFWMLDRKVTRLRFLVAYFYLIALPVGLLIWRAIQGVEMPVDISWWQTIWPFFSLAILFFVLEIIVLIITRDSRSQAISIAKDVLFVALYVICLIAAIPEASAS